MSDIYNTIQKLQAEGLPFPLSQCQSCGNTMYKKDRWIQCPTCGALSTAWGGVYPADATEEWVTDCAKADQVLATLTVSNI